MLGFSQGVPALDAKCSFLGTCWSQDTVEGWGGLLSPPAAGATGRQGRCALLGGEVRRPAPSRRRWRGLP